jgi:hypothetical protein
MRRSITNPTRQPRARTWPSWSGRGTGSASACFARRRSSCVAPSVARQMARNPPAGPSNEVSPPEPVAHGRPDDDPEGG